MLSSAVMLKDVAYAFRLLTRTPLFTIVAALSLAIGIGGTASVFTVLNGVVLRTLPIPTPHQLFVAEKQQGSNVSGRYAWPLVEQARNELRGRAELFAATNAQSMQIRIAGRSDLAASERGMVTLVSGEYFDALRQRARVGRLIGPGDNQSVDAHPVAVISDAYWERRFNRSADIVGRQLIVGGATLNIIGVAAPGFFGPWVAMRNPDVWVPLLMQSSIRYSANVSSSDNADLRKPWSPQPLVEWLQVFARVPQAGDVPTVASALTLLHQRDAASRIEAADTEGRQRLETARVVLQPASRGVSSLRDTLSSPLFVLLAMVGVLLAITCGNVASLLVARASAREREIAIRVAIGADRWRVVRQLLIETLMLSLAGGGLGLLLAAWGRDALLMLFARGASVVDLDVRFDPRVLLFALGVTVLSGIAAGLIPALRATRVAPTDALKTESRQVGAGGGVRGARVGKTLVVAQIAFCLLLLVVAGLFMRSMQTLLTTNVGYDREHLLVARLDIRNMGYSNEQRQALHARVIQRLQRIPGVTDVSISLNGPMNTSRRSSSLGVEGYTRAPGEQLLTDEEIVTEDYFRTVGLEIVQGRGFTADDRHPGTLNTLVNETMARRFFPEGDAIGKRWTYGEEVRADSPVIVGVVKDARYREVRGEMPYMTYRLSASHPDEVLGNLEIRATAAPASLVNTVRQALAEAEPSLPVFDVVPLDERMNRGLSNDRLVASLTGTFGAIALVLACLGLYGTISFGVSRRVTELGVRMALGANRRAVLWLVVREALMLVVIGACIGFPLAVAAGRSIGSLLYQVGAIDPAAYGASALLLLAIASVAALLPAHRASRIDPMAALRRG